ncbi:MAG: oxidoreductase [Thermoleophilia bacterium]|nr:oxidoreductase [Thermoleophilia bacterium]
MSNLYELAGGGPAIKRLSTRFYVLLFADPLLTPLFPEPSQVDPEEHAGRLTLWLIELLGGPPLHTQQRGGFDVMRDAHSGLKISEAQRAAWAGHMRQAAADCQLPEEVQQRLMPFIEGGSTFAQRVSWPVDQRWAR